MKPLVKIYEETKKLNSDLTQYEFSTDFLNKKGVVIFGGWIDPLIVGYSFHTNLFIKSADLFIGIEGGMHHAAAALNKKAVVIFGGFIHPSITGYDFHKNLYIDNERSPCGLKDKCDHCQKCMELITVYDVKEAIIRLL